MVEERVGAAVEDVSVDDDEVAGPRHTADLAAGVYGARRGVLLARNVGKGAEMPPREERGVEQVVRAVVAGRHLSLHVRGARQRPRGPGHVDDFVDPVLEGRGVVGADAVGVLERDQAVVVDPYRERADRAGRVERSEDVLRVGGEGRKTQRREDGDEEKGQKVRRTMSVHLSCPFQSGCSGWNVMCHTGLARWTDISPAAKRRPARISGFRRAFDAPSGGDFASSVGAQRRRRWNRTLRSRSPAGEYIASAFGLGYFQGV